MNILIFISSFISFVLSQSQNGTFGQCGTLPGDKFTHLDDAERPFCFKFKNAITPSGDPWVMYYYFGSRVDKYTLVQLQGCMYNIFVK